MNDGNKYIEYVVPREDITYVVEFCNVETSSQLLAVGTELRVSLYRCKFRVNNVIICFRGCSHVTKTVRLLQSWPCIYW